MTLDVSHFWPAEGAFLDLASLGAIADAPSRLLDAFAAMTKSHEGGLVLDGLDLAGDLQSAGPPGTRRPDGNTPARVSAGTALLRDASGRRYVLQVPVAIEAPWPDASGSGVRGALVVKLDVLPVATSAGLASAQRTLRPRLGFAALDRLADPDLLPLAVAVGNGRDWATDLARVWQPEHEAVRTVVRKLDQIEQMVWRAEPEGSVWDRGILGRNWVRYQTVAATALQVARMSLESRPSTTVDRVRLLSSLRRQLAQSVERAATEMLQIVGPHESAGPYREVLPLQAGS